MVKYDAVFGSKLYSWNPQDESDCIPGNCEYLRRVFLSMESYLGKQVPPLQVFLTDRLDRLPEYGKNVIAVVIGDECGRPPLYAQDIGVTFKYYGTTPDWEAPKLAFDSLNVGRMANSLRNVARSIPHRGWVQAKSVLRRLANESARPMYEIPLGYNDKQANLSVKPIEARDTDVFFAGTVPPRPTSPFSLRRWISPPKQESRRRMVERVRIFDENNEEIECKLITPKRSNSDGFLSSEKYSKLMMNSKVCLVPRGNNTETWRFFEAMRYGCIVVAEKLPQRWYYKRAPFFEINEWSELKKTLNNIFRKLDIKKEHKKSKTWWSEVASEKALGKYMGRKVKKHLSEGET